MQTINVREHEGANKNGQSRETSSIGTYDRRRRQTRQKHITLYVLDTTMRTIQAEDKQNKKHNTIYVEHHYA